MARVLSAFVRLTVWLIPAGVVVLTVLVILLGALWR